MTKQKWTGVYSYDAKSLDEIPENAPTCEMHLEVDDEGGITGQLIDSVYANLTERIVPIGGFMEDNFLSLVAHYPFKMERKENGEAFLDQASTDYEVPFYGELSEDLQEMIGSCEEMTAIFEGQDKISDALRIGFFKLKRNV